MTPSPEHVGSGIVSLEADRQLIGIKADINTIITNAIGNIKADQKVILSGMIAERERLPSGVTKEYFHPTIIVEDKTIKAYNEGAFDDLVLGGTNFEKLFPHNHHSKSVDWGGKAGKRVYRNAPEDESNPFYDFFEGRIDAVFLNLVEVKERFYRYELGNEANAIEKGEIADSLLPRTVNAEVKLALAQRLLTGLKNASGVKEGDNK